MVEKLSEKIIKFFENFPNLVAIYIFGSIVLGTQREKSDIDIALMVKGVIPPMDRINLETSLSNELKKDVDLIIFTDASPLLQHQILKYGYLIYEADPKERVKQEVFSRRQYLDTKKLYKAIQDYL